MTEANFQTRFGKWIVSAGADGIVCGGAAFELKLGKAGKGLSFSAVKEHQVESLMRARGVAGWAVEGSKRKKVVGYHRKQGGAFKCVVQGLGEVVRNCCGGLYHKISDMALGFKPCDCIVIRNGGGWLVVQYWKPGERGFYMVDVVDFDELRRAKGGRGSMSEAEAGEIGVRYEFGEGF